MQDKIFNLRVYGILINEKKEILLSEEHYGALQMLKFPGGGLEYGEGTIECLQREFKEEAGISIEAAQHYYTTDHFQKSFINNNQIISIYYIIKPIQINASALATPEGQYIFYPLSPALIEQMTMPIDKKVMKMILADFN